MEARIISHVKVCGSEHTYCGHPVEAGEIFNFGNGEIAFMHLHTEGVDYAGDRPLWHGQTGIHAKAKIVLTRSFDGGLTWPKEERTVVFDQGAPVEEQEAYLSDRMTEENTPPLSENSVFHFGKSFSGPFLNDGVRRQIVAYGVRPEDKGHTWSGKVTIPDNIGFTLLQAHGPMIRQGDRLFKSFVVSNTPDVDNNSDEVFAYAVLYSSENNGVTWQYVSDIMRDPKGEDNTSYVCVLDLGGGHLFSTCGCWHGPYSRTRWISAVHSYDNGLNWESAKRIRSFGISPYPLLLKDGRILVVYCKRYPASVRGIYGMISEDAGMTFGEEFAIRQGASGGDLGYPVAVQNDDGTIFTGYYYMTDDGQARGGARHIAGTVFTI